MKDKIKDQFYYKELNGKPSDHEIEGFTLHREDGPALMIQERDFSYTEEWHLNGVPHREGAASRQEFLFDGTLICEHFYLNGRPRSLEPYEISYRNNKIFTTDYYYPDHDNKKPARLQFDENNKIVLEIWEDLDGNRHRDGGPSFIRYKGEKINFEKWEQKGLTHRDGGAAEIYYHDDGSIASKHWYQHGKIHREDGPAVTLDHNGSDIVEMWYLEDQKISVKSFKKENT